MELVRIEIQNYKSVIAPLSVPFFADRPTVLIGKNGSGKSNILDALAKAASANAEVLGTEPGDCGLRYKAYGRLSPEEFAKLFPTEKYSPERAEFAAYSMGKGHRIDTVESETVVPLLRRELTDIRKIAEELSALWPKFYPASIVKESLDSLLQRERSSGTRFTFLPPWYTLIGRKWDFLAPTAANYSAAQCGEAEAEQKANRFSELIHQLQEQTGRLLDERGILAEFLRNAGRMLGSRCHFLQNENSAVLFREQKPVWNPDYRSPSRMIYETYARSVYTGNKENAALGKDGEMRPLSEEERQAFETYLNENLPTFERDMFSGISVVSEERGEISIRLKEKTGAVIPLESTSAGRRWYFSYYFVKNALQPGDAFIIDEPASMLHPCAQKEVFYDLTELAKSGIRVVYSTHSPYLIPEYWNNVCFVRMGEGTELLSNHITRDELDTFRANSPFDIFSYQEIAEAFKSSKYKKIITKNVTNRILELFRYNCKKAWQAMKVTERTWYNWQGSKKEISLPNLIKAAELLHTDALTLIEEAEG